jgi:siderophore synthetase component
VTAVVERSSTTDYLVQRVLDALLREDYRGMRSRATPTMLPELDDGAWLSCPLDGAEVGVPVRPGGFLCDHVVRRPLLARRTSAGAFAVGLEDVLALLRPHEDAEEQAGYDAFADECRRAKATLNLHEDSRADVLASRLGSAAEPAYGMRGSLHAETLAAFTDHPVYPTSRARLGLSVEDLRRYAPEFAPTFALRWLALPRDAIVVNGRLPARWPSCERLGLPGRLDATHLTVPVHPLTWDGPLDAALAQAGLTGTAARARSAYLDVTPTLSMRAVALVDDPGTHVKLPLPTSTLGVHNRRSIVPGTLPDAALTQRLLGRILRRERSLGDRILLADETTYGHARQEYLGFLVRRYPAAVERARVVPVAALLAETGAGRLLIEDVAADFFGGNVLALFDAYLTLLFRWHTTLWLRYGIALESHQQNVSLVLDGPAGMRLLYKDNDGPRIDLARLTRELGPAAPTAQEYDDRRILAESPRELADVYTTITLHLCAGALAFGLADRGIAAGRRDLLRLVRRRLEDSLDGLTEERDAGLFRERILDAERLPVKSMVTAGTLRSKQRTGARDINKYYGTTGPNYLRAVR